MNRSLLPLLLLSACSLHAATATGADTAPAAAAAPAADGACDAANNHCLPAGVQFSDGTQREGGRGPVWPCVERDGVWYSLESDSVCKGPAFHRTEPATAGNLTVGALSLKQSRPGRWIIGKVERIDPERGTFRHKGDYSDSMIADARLVVATRTVAE